MTHSASITRSPSSLSLTWSTPCVDGCCGPMLTVISLASNRVSSLVVDIYLILRSPVVRSFVPGFPDVIFLSRIDPEMLPHPFHILQPDVVILAERITGPIL